MVMRLKGLTTKDLAESLGRIPTAVSRMLNQGTKWTYNDMVRASRFVGLPLEMLGDPDLNYAKIYSYESTRDGGIAVDDGLRRLSRGEFRALTNMFLAA